METIQPHADEAATLMKALANPHRLMILCQLHEAEQSVGVLAERIGLSQSALSQHLAKLRGDGLVTTRRAGQTIHYSLASAKVIQVIALLHSLYCDPRGGDASGKELSDDA